VIALIAELPALPLHTAGKYVAAAYIVLFAMVLVYLAIMAIRMSRTERELGELLEQLDQQPGGREHPAGHTAYRGTDERETSGP
jgi:hypothetical protein